MIAACLLALQLEPPSLTRLRENLKRLECYQVAFSQVTESDFFDAVHAEGHMWVRRPGRLRMEYQKGERKLVLCDGHTFYEYDFDGETELRVGEDDFAQEPLVRIFLLGQDFEANFIVDRQMDEQGREWFRFQPRNHDDFSFTMRFDEKNFPIEVTLTQVDGASTSFHFSDWKILPALDEGLFLLPQPGSRP
jgi:outer membrane lipoprotein-sorting protein